MKIILLAAGAAALAIGAGPVMAASKTSTAAGPKQPIPYSQLDAYLKASPKQRASKDWWSGQAMASTGAGANTAATATAGADVRSTPDATPTTPTPPADPATSASPPSLGGEAKTAPPPQSAPPPTDAPATGQVNPPASTTTPPK